MPIRVFIADDHGLVREGLRGLIESRREFTVVGEAGSGDDVITKARHAAWDVLLLDLSLPGVSGLELVSRVRAIQPKVRILVLTMRPEDGYAVRLIRAGVLGYVTKDASSSVLIGALEAVAAGRTYYSDQLEFLLLDTNAAGEAAPHHALSEREADVFRFYVGGLSTNDIAVKLSIDASTVSTHLKNIRVKLGVQSNRQIISYASDHKLITAERA